MSKTILTVDDSTSIRAMVSATLRAAGYQLIEAVDGQDGLEKAKANPVNLVLTDHNMPRMDGLTLIRSLRAMPSYREAPILVLTTESSAEMRSECKAAGATGCIVKPFDPDRLVDVVKRVLG